MEWGSDFSKRYSFDIVWNRLVSELVIFALISLIVTIFLVQLVPFLQKKMLPLDDDWEFTTNGATKGALTHDLRHGHAQAPLTVIIEELHVDIFALTCIYIILILFLMCAVQAMGKSWAELE